MPGTGELVLVAICVAVLLLSGLWTELRFRRFERLPAHYDFRGRPTRFSSRRVIAWLLPISFSVMLVGITYSSSIVPDEARRGDPMSATLFSCVALLGAQAFALWLLSRWAREQS